MSKNSKDCPKASTFLILSSREQSCLRRRSKEKAIRTGHEITTRRYSKTSLTTSARLMFLFPSEGRLLIIRRVPLDKSRRQTLPVSVTLLHKPLQRATIDLFDPCHSAV